MGSDGAVCDVDSAAVVHGLFLNDALGRGTQVENVFARGVEEVWIRERESPAARIGRIEGDARVGPTVCFDEIAAVISIFENVCYGRSIGGESAHPGYATVDGAAGHDEDKARVNAADAGGDVALRHGIAREHCATTGAKNPDASCVHNIENVLRTV